MAVAVLFGEQESTEQVNSGRIGALHELTRQATSGNHPLLRIWQRCSSVKRLLRVRRAKKQV
jgi:hypothetical protein